MASCMPGLGLGCAVAFLAVALLWAWKKGQRDLPHQEVANVEYALLIGTLLLVLPILLTLDLNALNPGDFLHGRYTYLPSAGLMLSGGDRMAPLREAARSFVVRSADC